jgi:hypothetical protein
MGVGFNKLDREAVNAPDIGEKNVALGLSPQRPEERDSGEGTKGWAQAPQVSRSAEKNYRSRTSTPPADEERDSGEGTMEVG